MQHTQTTLWDNHLEAAVQGAGIVDHLGYVDNFVGQHDIGVRLEFYAGVEVEPVEVACRLIVECDEERGDRLELCDHVVCAGAFAKS